MKKLIFPLAILAAVIFSTQLFAGIVFVPKAVKQTFSLYFKDATDVNWDRLENGALKASFLQNESEMDVYFLPSGELKRIDKEVQWKDLPVDARSYISDNFKKATIYSIKENQDATSEAPFIVELAKKNKTKKVFFSKTGEMVYSRRIN